VLHKYSKSISGAIIAGVLCAATVKADDALEIMYHERPPYYIGKNDKIVSGIVGDIVTRILNDAQIDYRYRQVPANRQLNEIKNNQEKICAIGWFKTPAREAFAKYSDSIYQDKPIVLMIRSADPKLSGEMSLARLKKNTDLRMGAKLGYSYGTAIDALAVHLKSNVITVSQDNTGLSRMLTGNRFDFFFAAAEEAPDIMGESNGSLEVKTLGDAPPGNNRYILCTISVEDALIKRINNTIGK
jgi:polar amino acid transport system substrate-binding protein